MIIGVVKRQSTVTGVVKRQSMITGVAKRQSMITAVVQAFLTLILRVRHRRCQYTETTFDYSLNGG
jgi:hypothetical protein